MTVKVLIIEDNPVARSFLCRVVRESFSDAMELTEVGDLENARRQVAKLFGKPDPGAFDIAKLLPVTYVVAALLMGMSALLIYADIVKPVNLFG